MINPQCLELPMSRTNFHGPKDVRAIEVRLYNTKQILEPSSLNNSFKYKITTTKTTTTLLVNAVVKTFSIMLKSIALFRGYSDIEDTRRVKRLSPRTAPF